MQRAQINQDGQAEVPCQSKRSMTVQDAALSLQRLQSSWIICKMLVQIPRPPKI